MVREVVVYGNTADLPTCLESAFDVLKAPEGVASMLRDNASVGRCTHSGQRVVDVVLANQAPVDARDGLAEVVVQFS